MESLIDSDLFGVKSECPLNLLAETRELATSDTILVILPSGHFLHLLFLLGFTFSVIAPEGQYRLTEKPELEDIAVHIALDSL